MQKSLPALPLLVAVLWLSSSACGPSRKLQTYDYLTKDASTYVKKTPPREGPTSEAEPPATSEANAEVAPVNEADALPSDMALIVQTALSYEGTPYRYGGTSRRGMDCSGLVCTSFQAADRRVPRTSTQMASDGKSVPLRKVSPGHIVLFSAKGGRRIDHAGLVVSVEGEEVSFIHATTSGGVRVDELSNPYWKKRFRKAVEF